MKNHEPTPIIGFCTRHGIDPMKLFSPDGMHCIYSGSVARFLGALDNKLKTSKKQLSALDKQLLDIEIERIADLLDRELFARIPRPFKDLGIYKAGK